MNTATPDPPAKRKRGRPRLDDAEKARRSTLYPSRVKQASRPRRPRVTVPSRDYLAVAAAYEQGVLEGSIVAGRWVHLAVERQRRDRRRVEWGYVWDPAHAAAVCTFVEHCPHIEGRWVTPTIHLEPSQVWLLTTLYGWRWADDAARRRFTTVYWEVGRKAAKSTIMAALLLYHLAREDEPGAQGICGATTGQQARVVFGILQRMVRVSLWLRQQGLTAFAHAVFTDTGTIKPINSKASSQDGLNPSMIVLDESHAQTFELHDVLKSAQGARRNPLLACPTTAGYDVLSVGYALRTTTIKVLEEVVHAEHHFGVIYALDEGDDWRDERVWPKAMPMIGITPTREWVRQYALDAQNTQQLEAEFRVKMCSEWLNSALTWLSMPAWDRCADPALRIEQFKGQPCWIGGDLAQLDDLAALAAVFHLEDRLVVFVKLYLPEQVVMDRARAVPEYRLWATSGILTLTSGNMIDYAKIEADTRAWCSQFAVRDICFDQFGSVQIVGNLSNDGLPARVEPKNARTMTPPARELEARIKHGRFRHDGNSCLRWQASNAVVRRRVDDSLVPQKDAPESPNKIDAIDAVLNAINGWLRQPAVPAPKAYRVLVV